MVTLLVGNNNLATRPEAELLTQRHLRRTRSATTTSDDATDDIDYVPRPPRKAARPRRQLSPSKYASDESSDSDFFSAPEADGSDASYSVPQAPRSNKRSKLRHSEPSIPPTPRLSEGKQRAGDWHRPSTAASQDSVPGRSRVNGKARAAAQNWPSPSDTSSVIVIGDPNHLSAEIHTATKTNENDLDGQGDMTRAPYYWDAKLDRRMYCGPGYESFPIALGTVDGHRAICDRYDQDLALGVTPGPLNHKPNRGSISPPQREEHQILRAILEVFPNIQQNFALETIRNHDAAQDAFYVEHVPVDAKIESVVSHLLETPNHPREPPSKANKLETSAAADGTGVTINWDKSVEKDASYLKDAVILLAAQFAHIPTHYVNRIVHEKKSIFDAYIHLHEVDTNFFTLPNRPYYRLRTQRSRLEKKYASRTPYEQRDEDRYPQLVNEIQAAKQQIARQAIKLNDDKARAEAEANNLELHKATGDLVECGICFDDEIPINRAVTCEGDNMHFFCFGCVGNMANSQIGEMKYEMRCQYTGQPKCDAPLSVEGVERAIPVKTLDRLAFCQQQADIRAAGIDGLEQCPLCDFKMILDPVEQNPVFNCQNPDCGRSTCRKCKEDAHMPKTCKEMKADRGLSARHLVEEARSESILRRCPRCKVPIIKEYGCNKVMCSQCRCVICYECKADITSTKNGGYHHFNAPGAKCKLYDNDIEARHDREADAAEVEAIAKVKKDNAQLDEEDLQVETGPNKKKEKKTHVAGAPIYVPQLHAAYLPPFAGYDVLANPIANAYAPFGGVVPDGQQNIAAAQVEAQLRRFDNVGWENQQLMEDIRRRRERRMQQAAEMQAAARQAQADARQAQADALRTRIENLGARSEATEPPTGGQRTQNWVQQQHQQQPAQMEMAYQPVPKQTERGQRTQARRLFYDPGHAQVDVLARFAANQAMHGGPYGALGNPPAVRFGVPGAFTQYPVQNPNPNSVGDPLNFPLRWEDPARQHHRHWRDFE